LLTVVPYERLLPLPLAEVRRRLHLPPPRQAHPDGILVGGRNEIPQVGADGDRPWPMSSRDAA
jgi:hypothetical protein